MRLDVEDYRRMSALGVRLRIEVDGVDVTDQCFAADDEEGWADCYVADEDGRRFHHKETGLPAAQRIAGKVRFINFGQVTLQ